MRFSNLWNSIFGLRWKVLNSKTVQTNDWQGRQENFKFLELLNVSFTCPMPETEEELIYLTECDEVWCKEHFQERVSGIPFNPPPSHTKWLKDTDKYMSNQKFSHTYPERFWPKTLMNSGIRFKTADFNDLLSLLRKNFTTRQAYLPIYFPEDLIASNCGERVPCTLGYHFIIRDHKLYVFYSMRSCDIVRHYHNDLYLTVRLAQFVRDCIKDEYLKLNGRKLEMGELHFACTSLHCFENDKYFLKKFIDKNEKTIKDFKNVNK